MDGNKTSQALTKRNAETSLMPPPPPPKRIKRPTKVLDEDVYTDTLSHIIARDFFPGLLETEAQQEYLTALDSNNTDWIREAGRKLHQAMTPGPGGRGRRGTSMAVTPRTLSGQTPSATPKGWGGDTPRRAAPSETPMSNTGDDQPKRPEVDPSLSLAAFQTKYTSEDNESFNALLDRQNIKRAEKYAFLHNANKIPTARQLEYRKQQQIASSSDSTALTIRPSQNLDDRPAQVEGFKSKQGAKNSLMFGPDSIEDTHTTVFQAAADASLAAPKAVNYASTRLPAPVVARPESSIPPSPSMSAIDAAIAGRPRPSDTDVGYSGSETPRVAGYTFVDAEPTPSELGVPISDEEAEIQEREAAMALMPKLDSEAEKGGFKLQSQSKREELHHRIVDKQNSQRRKPGDRLGVLKGAATPGATPKFEFSPGVAVAAAGQKKVVGSSLTPAARLLADRIGRTPRREGQGSSLFGGQKEKSRAWTPTPRLVRKG